jgi:hypothetical protein
VSDSNVIKLPQPGAFSDCLTEILRSGARALLTQAVEAEVAEFLAKHSDLKTETGQQRVVRHGHRPVTLCSTTIGALYASYGSLSPSQWGTGWRARCVAEMISASARSQWSKSLPSRRPSSSQIA